MTPNCYIYIASADDIRLSMEAPPIEPKYPCLSCKTMDCPADDSMAHCELPQYEKALKGWQDSTVRFENVEKIKWILWDNDDIVPPSPKADFEVWKKELKPDTIIGPIELPELEVVWQIKRKDDDWMKAQISTFKSTLLPIDYEQRKLIRFKS